MESGDRSAACMEEIKAVRSDEETSRRTGQLKSERARCPKNENKKNLKKKFSLLFSTSKTLTRHRLKHKQAFSLSISKSLNIVGKGLFSSRFIQEVERS